MTGFALSWVRADEDIPADPAPTRSTCAHVWGVAYRTGNLPGVIGNLFQRDCKRKGCKGWQVWRGTQFGTLRELVRKCAG